MPGSEMPQPDPSRGAGEASCAGTIHCPVHRVEIEPCADEELAPLLGFLQADERWPERRQFPRGTVLGDGRLDLCKQSLGTHHCLRLADAVQHSTQVRSLLLGTNAIGDAGAEAVARLAAAHASLEVLYLGCNNIGPQGAQALADALGQARQVTGLWLKRNPLGPQGAQHLAPVLARHRGLRVLDLVNTDLQPDGLRAVVDAACSNDGSLQSLYLGGNGLEASAAACLGRLLREAPHLRALHLSVNRLGDEGAAHLAEALRANCTLEVLDLASNGIGPAGAQALFHAAREHPRLQRLGLGYAPSTPVLGAQPNRLVDEGAAHAAELLASATPLRELDHTPTGITAAGRSLLAQAQHRNDRLVQLAVEGRLPWTLARRLQHNRQLHGELRGSTDRAMIKSVYR